MYSIFLHALFRYHSDHLDVVQSHVEEMRRKSLEYERTSVISNRGLQMDNALSRSHQANSTDELRWSPRCHMQPGQD